MKTQTDYRETISRLEDAMRIAQADQRYDDWRRLERMRHKAMMKKMGLWKEPPPPYKQGMLLEAA